MFSKQSQDVKKNLTSDINQRWGQLYQIQKESGERILKYLLLTNSGGAIATLSFLSASTLTADSIYAKIALVLFLLGIIAVGILIAKQFHNISNLFNYWMENVSKYYDDKITWKDLNKKDSERANAYFADYIIAYFAFACFIFGVILGACGFFI
ncbi:MAG: hypothetical protein HAW58_05760 [Candidatus Thioglobus sp.]|nr:hypothetical protein [Candidatus Thioglobus sp.]